MTKTRMAMLQGLLAAVMLLLCAVNLWQSVNGYNMPASAVSAVFCGFGVGLAVAFLVAVLLN